MADSNRNTDPAVVEFLAAKALQQTRKPHSNIIADGVKHIDVFFPLEDESHPSTKLARQGRTAELFKEVL